MGGGGVITATQEPAAQCFLPPLCSRKPKDNQRERRIMSQSDDHIYELRIYAIEPGRLPDMARRFRDDVSKLFPRHKIRVVGSWTAAAGPKMPAFVYLMRWSSLEERTAAFSTFVADPDWHEARSRTNAGSELVEHYDIQFLKALDSSGISEPMALDGSGVFELALHPSMNGRLPKMRDSLLKYELAAASRAGGKVVGAFEAITGPRLPGVVSLTRWGSAAAWTQAQEKISADAELMARHAAEKKEDGRIILGQADRYLMQSVNVAWGRT